MAYPRATSNSTNYVGVAKQASKGTTTAPAVFIPYKGAVTLDHGMAGDEIREAGVGPYVARMMKTGHDPSGGFEFAVRPKTAAQLLAWFLGADASVVNGSLYDHTATPDEAARIWLSIEQGAGASSDVIDRFVDCVLKTLTIKCSGNGDLMMSIGWFGLTPAWQATAATPTYEAGVSGSTPGGPYRAHEATYTVDGSGASNVQEWELALAWNYDEDIRLSKVTRQDALKLELTAKFKLKQLMDSGTMVTDFRKINYGSGSGTAADKNFYGSGAFVALFDNGLTTTNSRTLSLTVPNIDYTSAKYTDLNPDGSTMYLEREGTVKKVSGTAFVTAVSKTADVAAY